MPFSTSKCVISGDRTPKARVSTAWGDVVDCEESGASTIPLVKQLLERLNDQSEQLSLQEERLALQDELIQQLKDEIARLKGEKGRPKITPSTLEQKSGPRDNAGGNESDGEVGGGKRPGSAKRKKTTELAIHETQVLPPPNIPPGSVFRRVSRLRRCRVFVCFLSIRSFVLSGG